MKNVSLVTTRGWWNWFYLEYQDDHQYQFEHIKLENLGGNKLKLIIDNSIVMTEKENRNNVGATTFSWFKMIVTTDTDPFGWILNDISDYDKSDRMRAYNYVRGCKRLIDQIKKEVIV